MSYLRLLPAILSSLAMGAHFLRAGHLALAVVPVFLVGLAFTRKAWVRLVLVSALLLMTFVWIDTASSIIALRQAVGQPFAKMAAILSGVALVTLLSAVPLTGPRARAFFHASKETSNTGALAFLLTAVLLSVVQTKVSFPMLLVERFYPGAGWLEILLLSCYAAWIAQKLQTEKTPKWRRRIWILFSAFFFAQLLLGLIGIDKLLMTGELHVPVPAVVILGPIYRGEGFFMPILFASTLVLVGPAWCSYLCYFGAFDQIAASRRRTPGGLNPKANFTRVAILVSTVLLTIALRLSGISPTAAAFLALCFGVLGAVTMVTISRKRGVMFHCTVFCPLGLAANLAGKLSPFRMKVSESCDGCGACTKVCRFDALGKERLDAKKVGYRCSLCGDCVPSCKRSFINYKLPFLDSEISKRAFITLIAALHAVFLGVARL